jgi:hypothetical protein
LINKLTCGGGGENLSDLVFKVGQGGPEPCIRFSNFGETPVSDFSNAPLLCERRQREWQGRKTRCAEVLYAHPTGRPGEDSRRRIVAKHDQSVVRESGVRSEADDRVLVAAVLDVAPPQGGAADLRCASRRFSQKDVADAKGEDLTLRWREIHFEQVG